MPEDAPSCRRVVFNARFPDFFALFAFHVAVPMRAKAGVSWIVLNQSQASSDSTKLLLVRLKVTKLVTGGSGEPEVEQR